MRLNKYLLFSFVLLLPGDLFADGFFVWNKGVDLYEPSQKAVILHAGDTEDLILQVKYEGEATDFAWLMIPPFLALRPRRSEPLVCRGVW